MLAYKYSPLHTSAWSTFLKKSQKYSKLSSPFSLKVLIYNTNHLRYYLFESYLTIEIGFKALNYAYPDDVPINGIIPQCECYSAACIKKGCSPDSCAGHSQKVEGTGLNWLGQTPRKYSSKIWHEAGIASGPGFLD